MFGVVVAVVPCPTLSASEPRRSRDSVGDAVCTAVLQDQNIASQSSWQEDKKQKSSKWALCRVFDAELALVRHLRQARNIAEEERRKLFAQDVGILVVQTSAEHSRISSLQVGVTRHGQKSSSVSIHLLSRNRQSRHHHPTLAQALFCCPHFLPTCSSCS